MAKRKLTQADRERLERMKANADRLRELAEKGLADLERRRGGPIRRPGQTNAEWLSELAEKGLADLERKSGGPIRRPGQTNADWLRELAEKRKRDLEARGQAEQ